MSRKKRYRLPDIPHSLKQSFLDNRLILFVGAGLSRGAGAPSWRNLLNGLLKRFKQEAVVVPHEADLVKLINGNATDILCAAEYLQLIKKDLIGEYIRELCEKLPPQTVHHVIAKFPCAGIITTNYDNLIETAIIKGGASVNIILPHEVENLAKLEDKRQWLFKLHGSFENSRSHILSLTDYEKLKSNPGSVATLSRLFQNFTFLFLGYGLQDPDILDQLSLLNILFNGYQRRHYALVEKNEINPAKAQVMEKVYNIQFVKYEKSSDTHPEVPAYLTKLLRCKEKESSFEINNLLFIIPKKSKDSGELLLLVKSPNIQGELSTHTLSRGAYLFPTLTDAGYSEAELIKAGYKYASNLIELYKPKKNCFQLKIDRKPFVSKKVSPALGEQVKHRFRFVTVKIHKEILERIGPDVCLAGHVFEWQSLKKLREHIPTKQVNGDVVEEIVNRFGSCFMN